MDWCNFDRDEPIEDILKQGVVSYGFSLVLLLPSLAGSERAQADPLEGERGGEQPATVRPGLRLLAGRQHAPRATSRSLVMTAFFI